MASGKQTSFQYGEISPKNQYRNNDAVYSTALSRLVNMQVKRAGGVGKWPGIKLTEISSNQDNIPNKNIDYQRYKEFPYTFYNTTNKQEERAIISFSIPNPLDPAVIISIAGIDYPSLAPTPSLFSGARVLQGEGLKNVKVIQIGKRLIINGLRIQKGTDEPLLVQFEIPDVEADTLPRPFSAQIFSNSFTTPSVGQGAGSNSTVSIASAVQYLIMADHREYGEQTLLRFKTQGSVNDAGFVIFNGTDLIFPGGPAGIITGLLHEASLSNLYLSKIKTFNIYRAAFNPVVDTTPNFELVFKIAADDGAIAYPPSATPRTFKFTFNDTGAGDPAIAPALDFSAYTNVGFLFLVGTSCSAEYQDRHITAFSEFINNKLGPGDIAVSAIGSPMGFARPTILRSAAAFGFMIPSEDGSPVRQLVNAERLVAFTDNGTYIVQGGEQGIITPTQINPTKVSSEGSSKFAVPQVIGGSVIYVNQNHTKLMRCVFTENSTLAVQELSEFSDEFLDGREIIEMQKMPGKDDIVLLLRSDGTLISVTMFSNGVAGFSEIDTGDLLIETMTTFGTTTDPVLIFTGVQNGIRVRGTINSGDDPGKLRPEAHTNNAVLYGDKIVRLGESGYVKIKAVLDTEVVPKSFERIETINIEAITDYTTGSVFNVVSSVELDSPGIDEAVFETYDQAYDRIKYFYSENGEEKFIYINIDPSSKTGSGPYTYDAVADQDIPIQLQDVESQSIPTKNKLELQSRWLYATKRLRAHGSSSTSGLWALYLLLKDGADATPTTPDGSVDIAVRADGVVYSSPLNPNLSPNLKIVKEDGVDEPYLDLPEFCSYIEVGVPFKAYLETLRIERGGNETLSDDRKIVNKVGMALYETVGGFSGRSGEEDITKLAPITTRRDLDNLSSADELFTGHIAPVIPSEWTEEGKIRIIQVDPSPMTVLSVYPKGMVGN